jgi:hypothetical protein
MRIYPMEINPHIPLNTAVKECPPESGEKEPELIVDDLAGQTLPEWGSEWLFHVSKA